MMKFREPCLFLDFPPALPKCPMPPIEPRDFLPIHPWLEPCRGALEELPSQQTEGQTSCTQPFAQGFYLKS